MRARRHPRLRNFDYASPGAYFVTVCVRDRACVLGSVAGGIVRTGELGRLVAACWRRLPHHLEAVELDAFVVMPNHVHGIVILSERATRVSPLTVIVGAFKACATRAAGRPLWQRGYHDRVIRDERELTAIRQYIADNPAKWEADRENPARRGPSNPNPWIPRSAARPRRRQGPP